MLLLPTYSLFYTLSMSPPYEGKFQTLNMWSFWDMDVVLWILHTLQFWNKLNIQKLIALYSRWHSFHTETIIFSTNTFRLTCMNSQTHDIYRFPWVFTSLLNSKSSVLKRNGRVYAIPLRIIKKAREDTLPQRSLIWTRLKKITNINNKTF